MSEAAKFERWMAKIGNIHYSNISRMERATETIIEPVLIKQEK